MFLSDITNIAEAPIPVSITYRECCLSMYPQKPVVMVEGLVVLVVAIVFLELDHKALSQNLTGKPSVSFVEVPAFNQREALGVWWQLW